MRKYNAFTMMELSVSLVIIAILLAVMTTVFVQKTKMKVNTQAASATCQWQKMSGNTIYTSKNVVISSDESASGNDALLTVDKDSASFKEFYPINWSAKSFPSSIFNKRVSLVNNPGTIRSGIDELSSTLDATLTLA